MELDTPAIVVAVLPHGEHGAVVRFLTERDGLVAGYVPGGRSRALRPVLQPGNGVAVRFRTRAASQLASAAVELVRGRTLLATERVSAAALDWLCALTATALSEATPSPRLYAALDGLLDAMTFAEAPAQWLPGVVRFELLLLAELGFGLDLTACAATGERTTSPSSRRNRRRRSGARRGRPMRRSSCPSLPSSSAPTPRPRPTSPRGCGRPAGSSNATS